MTDRTLPNGQVVRNVPDDYTNAQLKQYALQKGLATEEDYNIDLQTNADYLSLAGEIGGSVGGAIAGATYGASVGTAVNPFFGTIIGGAIGAGVGYLAGEIGESYAEDRDFNVEEETVNALQVGLKDAAFGGAFGVVGKGISAVYKPVRGLFKPTYIKEGNQSEVAKMALAVKRGDTTLDDLALHPDVTPEHVRLVSEAIGQRVEDLERVARLHSKLMDRGSGLMPKQAAPEYKGGGFSQDYASSSYFFQKFYRDRLGEQDKYILDSFTELLGRATTDKTREETGIALAKLVKDSDSALKAVVEPLYRAIDKDGSIFVKTGTVKDNALRTYNAVRGANTSAQNSAKRVIDGIPETLSPAEVVIQKTNLAKLLPNVKADPVATKMIERAIKNLDGTLVGKKFVDSASTRALGKAASDELTKRTGKTGITGKHKELADRLKGMRDKMSFTEAHKELSHLKATQRDMAQSLGEKSTKADALINKAIGQLEKSMEETAKNFKPELFQKYDAVRNMYKEGINTIHGDWLVKALRKDNVADIGQYIVKSGESIGVKEIKALIAKAKELKVDNAGHNLVESIEKEFINNLFPSKSSREGLEFMRRMNAGKFSDTFNAIVGKEKGDKIVELGEEIVILSRGIEGSESALSLSIRSGEIGQVKKPTITGGALYALLGWAAKKGLSPKALDKKIKHLKAVNARLAKGEPVPQGVFDKIMEGAGTVGAGVGVALSM